MFHISWPQGIYLTAWIVVMLIKLDSDETAGKVATRIILSLLVLADLWWGGFFG